MPLIIGLVTLIGGIVFWVLRARMAANAATELADIAGTMAGAARRFGFRRRHDMHPVDCIEDHTLAAGALTVAFLQLGRTPTDEDTRRLHTALRKKFHIGEEEATELQVMGQWLVNECGGPAPAATRLSKRLNKLIGADGFDAPFNVVSEVAAAQGGLTEQQKDMLQDMRTIFRV